MRHRLAHGAASPAKSSDMAVRRLAACRGCVGAVLVQAGLLGACYILAFAGVDSGAPLSFSLLAIAVGATMMLLARRVGGRTPTHSGEGGREDTSRSAA